VALLVVFLLLAIVFILVLWGGSTLMQGWLYQSPANHMPARAAAAGAALAAFFTIWCWLDVKNPGKYDTLVNFSTIEVTDHDSFESVMRKKNGSETITVFKKRAGSNGATSDFADAKGHSWARNTNDSMAVAILIRDKDAPAAVSFKANLDAKGNFPSNAQLIYTDDSRRWMGAEALGRVHRRKSGVLFANIFLNALHFVLWWMALWACLRFSIWHAFGFAAVLWVFLMLAVQPVLFNQTRPREMTIAAGDGVAAPNNPEVMKLFFCASVPSSSVSRRA
jgi:hypothetical protein